MYMYGFSCHVPGLGDSSTVHESQHLPGFTISMYIQSVFLKMVAKIQLLFPALRSCRIQKCNWPLI